MHSEQQEPHGTFYVHGSQDCYPSGDESLNMSKLQMRHFQATDRVCMSLAYLAWYIDSRLKNILIKNEGLDSQAQEMKII